MTLVKRSNSPCWYAQFQIDQKTFIRSTKTTDRKVAERMEARFRAETHEELVLGRKKTITIGAALDAYLRSKAGTPNYSNLVSNWKRLLEELNPNRTSNGLADVDDRSEEVRRAQQDNYDLVILLLDTGARYSEIASVTWSQIDIQEFSLLLWRSKVQNESLLFLSRRAMEVVKRR